jgi:hypothetical protein
MGASTPGDYCSSSPAATSTTMSSCRSLVHILELAPTLAERSPDLVAMITDVVAGSRRAQQYAQQVRGLGANGGLLPASCGTAAGAPVRSPGCAECRAWGSTCPGLPRSNVHPANPCAGAAAGGGRAGRGTREGGSRPRHVRHQQAARHARQPRGARCGLAAPAAAPRLAAPTALVAALHASTWHSHACAAASCKTSLPSLPAAAAQAGALVHIHLPSREQLQEAQEAHKRGDRGATAKLLNSLVATPGSAAARPGQQLLQLDLGPELAQQQREMADQLAGLLQVGAWARPPAVRAGLLRPWQCRQLTRVSCVTCPLQAGVRLGGGPSGTPQLSLHTFSAAHGSGTGSHPIQLSRRAIFGDGPEPDPDDMVETVGASRAAGGVRAPAPGPAAGLPRHSSLPGQRCPCRSCPAADVCHPQPRGVGLPG